MPKKDNCDCDVFKRVIVVNEKITIHKTKTLCDPCAVKFLQQDVNVILNRT